MTHQEIATMIAGIGLPNAYYQFSEDTAVPPPFICFYFTGDNDVIADNSNYQKIDELTVELYTDEKDFNLEAQVEDALNAAGLVYSRDETYIDSEQMHMTTYYTDVVITASTASTATETTTSTED